jgi:hypothetical protein
MNAWRQPPHALQRRRHRGWEAEHLRHDAQQRHRHAEHDQALDEADQQLGAGAVVGEPVVLELALAVQIRAHAGLAPEVVDPRREQREEAR